MRIIDIDIIPEDKEPITDEEVDFEDDYDDYDDDDVEEFSCYR